MCFNVYNIHDFSSFSFNTARCGGDLVGTKGEFHSPNYPNNYPPHTNCTWVIKGNKNSKIVLRFRSFDFESK